MPVTIKEENLSTKRLFHIVPFEFNEKYDSFCSKLNKRNWRQVVAKEVECDLYDHIKEELYGKCTIGCVLEKEYENFTLFYKKSKNSNTHINININKANLYLYKNGIGFYVYELFCDSINNSEMLKTFINKYKEMSYPRTLLLKDTNKVDENGKHICECVSLGVWIAEELKNLSVEFMPSRENPYKAINENVNFELYAPDDCVYSKPKYDKSINLIPDKAICFSYVVFNTNYKNMTDEERDAYSFHISRAYKNSYQYTPLSNKNPYRELESIYWNACQEGCAYIAYPVEPDEDAIDRTIGNSVFYNDTQVERIKYSYVYLFIRALYQSRSILKYSREISEKLSFDVNEYSKGKRYKEVANLYTRINLFKTRVLSSSVSFITLQVDFYLFLKDVLHIEDDTNRLTEGLEALNSLQSETNSKRIDNLLMIISLLQGITSIAGVFDFICLFIDKDNINGVLALREVSSFGYYAFLILSIAIFVFIVIALNLLKNNLLKNKN